MYRCPFQGKSLVVHEGEVGFRPMFTSQVMVRIVSLSTAFMTVHIKFKFR